MLSHFNFSFINQQSDKFQKCQTIKPWVFQEFYLIQIENDKIQLQLKLIVSSKLLFIASGPIAWRSATTLIVRAGQVRLPPNLFNLVLTRRVFRIIYCLLVVGYAMIHCFFEILTP